MTLSSATDAIYNRQCSCTAVLPHLHNLWSRWWVMRYTLVMFLGYLLSPQNAKCLRDESILTSSQATTFRQTLQIKHAISSLHSLLTQGQPVPALTQQCSLSNKVTTRVQFLFVNKFTYLQRWTAKIRATTTQQRYRICSGGQSFQWQTIMERHPVLQVIKAVLGQYKTH